MRDRSWPACECVFWLGGSLPKKKKKTRRPDATKFEPALEPCDPPTIISVCRAQTADARCQTAPFLKETWQAQGRRLLRTFAERALQQTESDAARASYFRCIECVELLTYAESALARQGDPKEAVKRLCRDRETLLSRPAGARVVLLRSPLTLSISPRPSFSPPRSGFRDGYASKGSKTRLRLGGDVALGGLPIPAPQIALTRNPTLNSCFVRATGR